MSPRRNLCRALVVQFLVVLCLILGSGLQLAKAQGPSQKEFVRVYAAVIDPDSVRDIFGKRIAERFIVIQVTITNRNTDYQYLIQDVSLDLTKVFVDQGRALNLARSVNQPTVTGAGEAQPVREEKYELSSLELSLVRGVAEKGQGGDPRNRMLRYLRGIGTIAAGLIGVATFGPSYAESVAIFNGPFNSAFVEAFPDYTTNQMNRLSDSAYKSNTLVPKQQSRVLVAFIPQAIFMTKKQRDLFWKDPTLLYRRDGGQDRTKGNPEMYDIDFRKVIVRVDGSFITEVENLPPTATTIVIEPEEMQKFQQASPVVKGYVSGRSLQKARIDLLNETPTGLTVALDGTPVDNRLRFTIQSDKPVPPNTRLDFEISTDQSTQTLSRVIRYTADKPTISSTDPSPLTMQRGEQDTEVTVTFEGTNLISGTTRVLSESNKGVRVVPNSTTVEDGKLTVTLKIASNAAIGETNLILINGSSQSDPVKINVTAAGNTP
jgi:hypothetical protein